MSTKTKRLNEELASEIVNNVLRATVVGTNIAAAVVNELVKEAA